MEAILYRLQPPQTGAEGVWRFVPSYLFFNHPVSIQTRTTSRKWDDKDEREFTAMLKKELDKVHDFQKHKVVLIVRRRSM